MPPTFCLSRGRYAQGQISSSWKLEILSAKRRVIDVYAWDILEVERKLRWETGLEKIRDLVDAYIEWNR